jgi:pyrrolysine biosynthesis protein PylC
MRVAVVGGKLQGVEACYLAHRAGWEVILIDRRRSPPASGMCDRFFCLDIVHQPSQLDQAIRHVDFVIPAMEDAEGLRSLTEASVRVKVPLAFDPAAYATTSSKRTSDRLFHRLGLPAPRPWPDCDLPVMVKPTESSGSKGVMKVVDRGRLAPFLQRAHSKVSAWVIQEYLEGPSYSLEVMGLGGRSVTLQPTALEMDADFDCKRVIAPVELAPAFEQEFREITTLLAQRLRLHGIMDVEVIDHDGRPKILEIDARLPSQTPTAVERSTGLNMLVLLKEIFLEGRLPEVRIEKPCGAVYEHIRVRENRLEVSGEHIMAEAGPLHMEEGFFGADAALTNFSSPGMPWVATLMVTGANRETAWEKRGAVLQTIMERCGVTHCEDPSPDGVLPER